MLILIANQIIRQNESEIIMEGKRYCFDLTPNSQKLTKKTCVATSKEK